MIQKKILTAGQLFIILAFAGALIGPPPAGAQTTAIIPDQSYDASMPFIADSSVIIDGDIQDDEYGQIYENVPTGITVAWEYNDDNMTIGLEAAVTGWLAIGFGTGMEDSNILMVGVADSTVYCYDIIGLAGFDHADDVDEGGVDNIVSCAGTESGGTTTVELVFSFTPVDALDPIPEVDTIAPFFVGLNEDSDDKTRIHDVYDHNLDLYYKPSTINMETEMLLSAPDHVHQMENFSIEATIQDSNSDPVPGIEISIGYKTVFGNFLMTDGITDAQGKLTVEIFFENVLGPITLIAISQELLTVVDSTNTAYLSTEAELDITVDGEVEEEEPSYVITSRWALVGGFWLIGIIIWSTFGYNFYVIIQIFRHRNDPLPGEGSTEVSS